MSNNLPINADIKQIVGIETTWQQEPSIIGKGIITLTRDTDIWKQGDGSKTYIELEKLFKSTQYDELDPDVQLGFLNLDILPDIKINQLVEYRDDGKIHPVLPSNVLEILKDNIEDKSIFTDLFINGPNKIKFNKEYRFKIYPLYNIFLDLHANFDNQFSAEWIIFNNEKIITDKNELILRLLSIDSEYSVGDIITIYGRLKDNFLNIYSKWIKKEIEVVDDSATLVDSYIKSTNMTIIDNNDIVVDEWYWDDNNHYGNNKYILTIKTRNRYNRTVNISIKCSDRSVNISKIIGYDRNLQKFLIQYPEYSENTELDYHICVYDVNGNNIKFTIHQTVYAE